MRFDILLSVAHRPGRAQAEIFDDAARTVEHAESLGYSGVWLLEHHFTRYGLCPSALTMAAFLAGRTRRIRVGTGITIVPLDHPVKIAERVALVDQLSEGRLDFGVGRGSYARDFEAFDVEMSQSHVIMREAMAKMLNMWGDQPWAIKGAAPGSTQSVDVNPKPRTRPHPPIYVAANSPSTIGWAAENGFAMLMQPALDDEAKAAQVRAYAAAAERAGRPTVVPHALTCIAVLGETDEAAQENAAANLTWWIREGVTTNGLLARRASLPNYQTYFNAVDSAKKASGGDPSHVVQRFVSLNLIGSAETCRRRLAEIVERTGIEHIILGFDANELGDPTQRMMADFKRKVLEPVATLFPPRSQ